MPELTRLFQPLRVCADRRRLADCIARLAASASGSQNKPLDESPSSQQYERGTAGGPQGSERETDSLRPAFAASKDLFHASSDIEDMGDVEDPSISDIRPHPLMLQLFDRQILADTLVRMPQERERERRSVRTFLSSLAVTDSHRPMNAAPSLKAMSGLLDRFPNFGAIVDYLHGRTALAHLESGSTLQFPPLLLVGEPGVGKTAFAMALAEVLAVPLINFPMSHATGSFALGGLDPMYDGGGPGKLVREVALGKAVDPLVLLDELDKVVLDQRRDPLGPLYSLWEPHTAREFMDEGIKLPLNLCGVRWIATSNRDDDLHPALRSRCQIFYIPAPDAAQLRTIVRNVYVDLVQHQPWGPHFEPEPSDAVIDAFTQGTPRELIRRMTDAFAGAARSGRRALIPKDVPPIAAASQRMGFR
jgi:ATP-dependent Lon protease